MSSVDANILAFGHTHKPYHKIIADGSSFRHAINIGSVGKPKDGDPRACYVIIEWQELNFSVKDTIGVQFRRVSYDVEKSAVAVEKSSLPNQFSDMLREAY